MKLAPPPVPAAVDGAAPRIEKTEGLVLRIYPFSRTSHVVTWLSPDHGRLTTLIKGACRPKSAFLGQYDLFYTCELLFYSRDRNGLHIARECTPLSCRAQLRRDWAACACASYLCDLLARMTVPGLPYAALYATAEECLDLLDSDGASAELVHWFELRLLDAVGLAPRLQHCAGCGCPAAERGPWRFAPGRGGILCANCAAREAGLPIQLEADTAAILRLWQQSQAAGTARRTRCTGEQLLALRRILGMFLEFHTDLAIAGRRIALDLAPSGSART